GLWGCEVLRWHRGWPIPAQPLENTRAVPIHAESAATLDRRGGSGRSSRHAGLTRQVIARGPRARKNVHASGRFRFNRSNMGPTSRRLALVALVAAAGSDPAMARPRPGSRHA